MDWGNNVNKKPKEEHALRQELTLDEIKRHLQNHLCDGLVTVIGSGLSCAEGLPGMKDLEEHLIKNINLTPENEDTKLWEQIKLELKNGLESALLAHPPSPSLETLISKLTGSLIAQKENTVIQEVFNKRRTLKLTKLLKHLTKPKTGLPIITTNYDRLIEIAVEEFGMAVDTLFTGRVFSNFNEKESKYTFCNGIRTTKTKTLLQYKERALIYKPHGSLDWYLRGNAPFSYHGDLGDTPRLIITPGQNKYLNGYQTPFDIHRSKANQAIDQARSFLIIGYGFNDSHLETHLIPSIEKGKPTLILTHSLSDKAMHLSKRYKNVTSLEHYKSELTSGTKFTNQKTEQIIQQAAIWDIENFVKEVLEP